MRTPLTHNWKSLAAAALCCALPWFSAQAADSGGKFAIKGVGIQSCQDFVAARKARGSAYDTFRSWLEGYFTAVNILKPQTYDIVPWGTTEVWAVILDSHCGQNPNERFVVAVQKLAATVNSKRLTKFSQRVTVTVDGQSVAIYEDVLRQVQGRLADFGLYSGRPDGKFGPQTQEAVATFQISEGLDGTGLPDSLTVWKLIEP